MRIKRILASVLAAAIAVSATAISVSADLVKDINNDATVRNATITMNVNGALTTAGTDLAFTAATAAAGDTIVKTSVELKIITDLDKVSTVTKSADGPTVSFSTKNGAGFEDITKVIDTAAYQAVITVLVKNSTTDYAAADANTDYTVSVANGSGSAANGKVVVNDNTSAAGTVTGYTFDATTFTVAERAQIKDATGATLTLNFDKAVSTDNALITLNKGGNVYAVKVPAKGATSVTFDLAVADFFNAEYAAFEGPVFAFAIANGGDATAFASAALTFVAAEEPEETTTEEPEETTTEEPAETTTEAPEETSATADDIDEPADTGAAALVVAPAIISAIATIISKKRK